VQLYIPATGPPQALAPEAFAKAVKERSKGRLEMHIYWAGELGMKVGDYLKAVKSQAMDIAVTCDAYYAKDVGAFAVNSFIWMDPDFEGYRKLTNFLRPYGEKTLNEKYNASILWAQPMPMVYPFGKKPIDDFFNMKGFKMRVYSAEFADFYAKLGGTGVFMPWEEVYTGLDKGVVDGYTSDIVKLESLKLYEVIKYHYDMFMETNGCIWVMSQASFNALPKDLQQIVKEEADKTVDKYLKDAIAIDKRCRDLAYAKGVQRVVVPPDVALKLRAMVRTQLHPKWVEKLDPVGKEAYQKALGMMK
jgi:TRAP-type C4-dicarboxylate transport system substrate-binding protein